MTDAPESQLFQLDLRGIVDLLSKHIYSSPRVYLRELLQNAVDALTARAQSQNVALGENPWGIRVTPLTPAHPEFVIADDGIGLCADEVAELLATVGHSSKRDILDLPKAGFLGQFGIGLLSCFMVAEDIRIVSASASGAQPVEWIGHQSGTFTVRLLDEEIPVGTSVHLTPRFDTGELLSPQTVTRLATDYGEFLPVPIDLELPGGPHRIHREPPFVQPAGRPLADRSDLMEYGRELTGEFPFDAIELSAPGTGTTGTAYVLPYSPPPNSRQATRVYLGRMLLTESANDLLPDWAFFVRAVINSTGLSPTASREGLVEDYRLEYTRTQLGDCLRRWLIELTLNEPHKLGQFLAIHEMALKQLVLHDDELATMVTGWLTVDTSLGRMRIERLVHDFPHIRYAETLDEFQQVAAICREDSPIVNGGYVYDADIVRMLPSLYDVTVDRIDVLSELDRLDPPPLDDRALAVALEEHASAVLTGRDCAAVVRIMEQRDIPSLYVADPEVFRRIDRGRARDASGPGLWHDLLTRADDVATAWHPGHEDGPAARLCLNWGNPVIRTLARLDDEAVFSRCVQLLYVQSQLAGRRPLSSADRALMTTALSDLIALSVGLSDHDMPT